MDVPCGPVGVVSGCGEGYRLVASAVRVRAPVGDQLQLRQLRNRTEQIRAEKKRTQQRGIERNRTGQNGAERSRARPHRLGLWRPEHQPVALTLLVHHFADTVKRRKLLSQPRHIRPELFD